jgi:PAS domain S-box-containing protein
MKKSAARARGPHDHLITSALFDASPDCIKIIAPDGRLRLMNRAGCTALGLEPHTVSGVDWVGLLPPQVHGAGFKSLQDAALGAEVRFHGLSDGGETGLRRWDNLLTPLRNAAGEVENILCISRDVTDQTRGETPLADEAAYPPYNASMVRELDRLTGQDVRRAADLEYEPLSFRERECLFWTGLGKTAWETSVILDRSRRTVEFHLANAVKKLRAANKHHAVMIALDNGML